MHRVIPRTLGRSAPKRFGYSISSPASLGIQTQGFGMQMRRFACFPKDDNVLYPRISIAVFASGLGVMCLRQNGFTRQHVEASETTCNMEVSGTPGVHIWRRDVVMKGIPAEWRMEQKQRFGRLLKDNHIHDLILTDNMWSMHAERANAWYRSADVKFHDWAQRPAYVLVHGDLTPHSIGRLRSLRSHFAGVPVACFTPEPAPEHDAESLRRLQKAFGSEPVHLTSEAQKQRFIAAHSISL